MERISEYSSKALARYTALPIGNSTAPAASGRIPAVIQIEMLNNSTRGLTGGNRHPPEEAAQRPSVGSSASPLCKIGVITVVKAIAVIGLMLVGIGAGVGIFATRSGRSQNNTLNTEIASMTIGDGVLDERWSGESLATDVRSRVYRDHNTLRRSGHATRPARVSPHYSFGLG